MEMINHMKPLTDNQFDEIRHGYRGKNEVDNQYNHDYGFAFKANFKTPRQKRAEKHQRDRLIKN